MSITFDTRDFDRKSSDFVKRMADAVKKSILDVGHEVLRLGMSEVPHDKGLLQGSGTVEPYGGVVAVGYNKVYAARLHEHPEYKFQKGRKGKYLEDPIKNNLMVLRKHMEGALSGAL